MNPIISIIVPIYNTDEYLHRCISSILNQTFKELEVILVNDGSTDKSMDICNDFQHKDSRVRVIHKQNGGVASARNEGIKIAKGDYLAFVDSDDYIDETMYEKLYKEIIEHQSDIVVCDFHRVEGEKNGRFQGTGLLIHYTNIEALKQLYALKNGIYMTSVGSSIKWIVIWNKLYKKSLFTNISFEEGRIFEDELISHQLLYHSVKVTYVPIKLYHYMKRPNSILNSPFSLSKLDKVYVLKRRVKFFKQIKNKHLYDLALKTYYDVFILYYYRGKEELSDSSYSLMKLKKNFQKTAPSLIRSKAINWKQKAALLIFIISPTLFKKISISNNYDKRYHIKRGEELK